MTTTHKTLLTICGLLVIVVGFRAWLGFRSQPQLSTSPEVFTTVDALFTAEGFV